MFSIFQIQANERLSFCNRHYFIRYGRFLPWNRERRRRDKSQWQEVKNNFSHKIALKNDD